MIDQKQLEYLCKKYKIKYQFFESTDIVILDTGLDIWLIKHVGNNRDRPYCLMHKNEIKQTKRYHVQGWKRTLYQSINSLLLHKNIFVDHSKSQNTYKKSNKINNNKRRKYNH